MCNKRDESRMAVSRLEHKSNLHDPYSQLRSPLDSLGLPRGPHSSNPLGFWHSGQVFLEPGCGGRAFPASALMNFKITETTCYTGPGFPSALQFRVFWIQWDATWGKWNRKQRGQKVHPDSLLLKTRVMVTLLPLVAIVTASLSRSNMPRKLWAFLLGH